MSFLYRVAGNAVKCALCGSMARQDDSGKWHCNCGRPGLGDLVAAGLSAVGITKERISNLLGRPCACPQRQAALNRLGEKLGLPPGQTPPAN